MSKKKVDANGVLNNAANIINFNGISDIGVSTLYGAYMNAEFPVNTQLDFRPLQKITKTDACHSMFEGSIGITSVDLSSLTQIKGTNSCYYMFKNCRNLISVDLSSLVEIDGTNSCSNIFEGCSSLTTISFSSLLNTQAGTGSMFKNCSNLTSIDFSSLVSAKSIAHSFVDCTSLTILNFLSLKNLQTTNALYNACNGARLLANIYFPALTTSSFGTFVNQFNSLLTGVTGCTIHFPKNLDPQSSSAVISSLTGYPNFGGKNTVLSFDLPSTLLLTGANTIIYERNPKNDTQTALCWRKQDTGTTSSPVVDWTPYYTSGTIDPAVADTIYSDNACTTAVTTISSIA